MFLPPSPSFTFELVRRKGGKRFGTARSRSRSAMMAALLYVTASMMWSLTRVGAFWFSIPQSDVKCVSEEIHSNVIVVADYNVFYIDQFGILPTVSSKVKKGIDTNKLHTLTWLCFFSSLDSSLHICIWNLNIYDSLVLIIVIRV